MPETQVFSVNPQSPNTECIQIAADVLHKGGLVAFPTETVYGLGANALDSAAVARIFVAKGRPVSDPIIVHLHDPSQLSLVARDVPDLAHDLVHRFWPGPLTLVLRRSPDISPNVSAGMDTVAVRIPNHAIPLELFRVADLPVAAPSANRFARPSATTAAHVFEDLSGRIDVILDGGAAVIGLESTILDLTRTPPAVLRPGGIALETLRALIPDLEVISKHLRPEDEGIQAPGMLYKHYSPRAELLLFAGSLDLVVPAMQSSARQLVETGRRIGILAPNAEQRYFVGIPAQIFQLGDDLSEISHNLFTGMRELDAAGVDSILVHGFEQSGLGIALWDRLLRAAEGRVIWC
ncbi:MAG: threonylcarbamoyl-AMP synthase [Anaerolineae bacterium]|nr:threonylcarbamoyl-AMP synthase [Anaerolineae bacterium]